MDLMDSIRKVKATERAKLERALCALADNEGPVKDALAARGHNLNAIHEVCDAIRLIVDGD